MKTKAIFPSRIAGLFLGILASAGLWGQSEVPTIPTDLFQPVSAYLPDVRQEGLESIPIDLTFSILELDLESLDDHDVWVVSPNGYNAYAHFEAVAIPDIFFDPADPVIGPNGEIINPPDFFWNHTFASYRIYPPEGEVWTEAQNGRYTVLLEPKQVRLGDGAYLHQTLLGSFNLAIGIAEPVKPVDSGVTVSEINGTWVAETWVDLLHEDYEVTWSELEKGNAGFGASFTISPDVASDATHAVLKRYSHRYELGQLANGHYRFKLTYKDELLAVQQFVVGVTEPPVPADVALSVEVDADGAARVHATIHFLDPYFVLSEPGEPVLRGDTFVIQAKASEVVFVRPPDEPSITEVDYQLQVPEKGIYHVAYYLNGELATTIRFSYLNPEEQPPVIHFFEAQPKRVSWGEPTTLAWRVTGASALEILPDVGAVQGTSVEVIPFLPRPDFTQTPGNATIGQAGGVPVMLVPLVERDAVWSYSDQGQELPAEWTQVDFPDADWASGPAQLGYGDGDEATEVSFGENSQNKHITTYFRHRFQVNDEFIGKPGLLWLLRDDGAVVYLNGHEILRSNMPAGEIGFSTLATRTTPEDGLLEIEEIRIDPDLILPGENLLAVEVHQAAPSSSDISFALGLSAIFNETPLPGPVTYTLVAKNEQGSTRAQTQVLFGQVAEQPVPEDVQIRVFGEDTGRFFAEVELQLPAWAQVIGWGELRRVENTFRANVELAWVQDFITPDGQEGGPAPEPNIFVYELGLLRNGDYRFALESGNQVLKAVPFQIPLDPNGDETRVTLRVAPITQSGDRVQELVVRYSNVSGIDEGSLGDGDVYVQSWARFIDVFPLPIWEEKSAELLRYERAVDGQDIIAVYGLEAPEDGWLAKHNGLFDVFLRDGEVETVNGTPVAGRPLGQFEVKIESEPALIQAVLRSEPITEAGGAEHRFRVIYESREALDVSSLGDNDVDVSSWVIVARFGWPPPIWAYQQAQFVEAKASEDLKRVEAVYQITAPDGGWSEEQNGWLMVNLTDTAIKTASGRYAAPRGLGEIQIEVVDSRRIPAEASIQIEKADNDTAAVVEVHFVDYPYHTISDWGKPEWVGNQVFLRARAERIEFVKPPELPLIERNRYLLGIPPVSNTIPFETVDIPTLSHLREPQTVVIQNEEEWNRLFTWIDGHPTRPAVPTPPVDLSTHTLIGVFAGEKPTGGYDLQILNIATFDGGVRVDYELTVPGIGTPVPEILTYPQHMVAIAKREAKYEFFGRVTVLPSPAEGEETLNLDGLVDPSIGILPPEGTLYWCVFQINGVTYARVPFVGNGNPPPNPDKPIVPSDLKLSADVDGTTAHIRVVADFSDVGYPVQLQSWGELQHDGHQIRNNLEVIRQEVGDLLPPGAPPVFENDYFLENLEPGHYQFHFTVNGRAVGHIFFFVGGDDPFFQWLGDLLDEATRNAEDGHGVPPEIHSVDDADGDGAKDYFEWAVGLNPLDPSDSRKGVVPEIVQQDGKPHLGLRIHRRQNMEQVKYILEGTTNFREWNRLDDVLVVPHQGAPVTPGLEEVTLCSPLAINESPYSFIRLRIEGGE